jgi:hypothetical protein
MHQAALHPGFQQTHPPTYLPTHPPTYLPYNMLAPPSLGTPCPPHSSLLTPRTAPCVDWLWHCLHPLLLENLQSLQQCLDPAGPCLLLQRAAEGGHWEAFEALLAASGLPPAADCVGTTVLHSAALGGNWRIVQVRRCCHDSCTAACGPEPLLEPLRLHGGRCTLNALVWYCTAPPLPWP